MASRVINTKSLSYPAAHFPDSTTQRPFHQPIISNTGGKSQLPLFHEVTMTFKCRFREFRGKRKCVTVAPVQAHQGPTADLLLELCKSCFIEPFRENFPPVDETFVVPQ